LRRQPSGRRWRARSVEVALFAANAENIGLRHNHVDLAADEFGGQRGQSIIAVFRTAVFD
jgi:hypothetical protein